MHDYRFMNVLITGCVVVLLLAACQKNIPQMPPPTNTTTPESQATSLALTRQPLLLTAQPPMATATARVAAYELDSSETFFSLGGVGDSDYGDIFVGFGGGHIGRYVDEEGENREGWVAIIWLGSERHESSFRHFVHVGQTIEFEGYRIRILGIREGGIDLAISESVEQ